MAGCDEFMKLDLWHRCWEFGAVEDEIGRGLISRKNSIGLGKDCVA